MKITKEKRLKYLLTYINKRSFEILRRKKEFDDLILEKYGIHYSDVDEDWIIDMVDYGTGIISFKEFDNLMLKRKKVKNVYM